MSQPTFLAALGGAAVTLFLPVSPCQAQEPFQKLAEIVQKSHRTIDGTQNNKQHPDWGSAEQRFVRLAPSDYADGVGAPAGEGRPSARAISNGVCAQDAPLPNAVGASDYVWQWGQFLDHDLDETPLVEPPEAFPIRVPVGDPYFDPMGTGDVVIPLTRSFWELDEASGARQQVNVITAFIDGSNVYGSDEARARALRTLDGTGRLKTSLGDLLPFNEVGLPNAPDASAAFFLAGDFRANEQVGLTAMHTLFVREHNYWADRIRAWAEPDRPPVHASSRDDRRRIRRGDFESKERRMSGEAIYQMARAIVVAELQAITYREFLPVLLGPGAPGVESIYRPDMRPDIANEFATAAYRFGHSMLPNALARVGADGNTLPSGDLPLASAFFAPHVVLEHGIDPLLRGLGTVRAQAVDVFVVDGVRNFLFGPPGSGGLDLPSLNIQRGRDHGLPSYVDLRAAFGLPRPLSFAMINSDPTVHGRLAATYADVGDIDAWVGGLAEEPLPGALVGPLVHAVLRGQFTALRDGDRYWYRRYLSPGLVTVVERQTLAAIVRRNTGIGSELQDDVFRVVE